ncbi:unnamed protein product [Closterium sp. NIES-53]
MECPANPAPPPPPPPPLPPPPLPSPPPPPPPPRASSPHSRLCPHCSRLLLLNKRWLCALPRGVIVIGQEARLCWCVRLKWCVKEAEKLRLAHPTCSVALRGGGEGRGVGEAREVAVLVCAVEVMREVEIGAQHVERRPEEGGGGGESVLGGGGV